MPRRMLVALATLALGCGLTACADADASPEDVQAELEDGGMTAEQASCVTDALFEDLDQGEINDVYEADGEPTDAAAEAIAAAVEECPAGG